MLWLAFRPQHLGYFNCKITDGIFLLHKRKDGLFLPKHPLWAITKTGHYFTALLFSQQISPDWCLIIIIVYLVHHFSAHLFLKNLKHAIYSYNINTKQATADRLYSCTCQYFIANAEKCITVLFIGHKLEILYVLKFSWGRALSFLGVFLPCYHEDIVQPYFSKRWLVELMVSGPLHNFCTCDWLALDQPWG